MCGIYGLLDLTGGGPPVADVLAAMGRVVEHRGPDDYGTYVGHRIGLGMRRLSIIDVAGGHQPISNEDSTVWVVMNGEIYNFKDLRSQLEKKGHQFRTRSDTEVIVHLYEEYGPSLFKHLRGMFGLAVWDAKRNRLVLGRDRIGEKPLYVRHDSSKIYFASELKSILQVDGAPRQINPIALEEYLALGYIPAPLTLLKGVKKVLPGHYLLVENDKVEDYSYWNVPVGQAEKRSETEWIELLRAKLLETVGAQMVSDVPLGAFLSGGIDSSLIVAAMSKHSSRPVKTYSIGYEGEHSYYNELPYAKEVAQAFGTEHHEIIVRPQVCELLPNLVWHLDEPIADSACITTYLVSKMARESVTVILSGVGGDELFGGYRRYLGESVRRWYRLLPKMLRKSFIPYVANLLPQDRASAWKDYARYAAGFLKTSDENPVTQYLSYVTLLSPQLQRDLLQSEFRGPVTGDGMASTVLQSYFSACTDAPSLDRIMYVDLKTSLPDDLLALTDRMSMAASVECRAPLVDSELIELTARMPSSLKVHGLKLKYILKKAIEPWLPPSIPARKKRGFGAPIGAWLRKDLQSLVTSLLSEERVRARGLFHWPAIADLIRSHQEQRRDYTDQLFGLIVLELWCETFVDNAAAPSSDSNLVIESY